MPLPLRVVQPVHVSRGTLPDRIRVRNELEAAANGTLANVIRQLSTLSHNAEEIFESLIRVGSDIANRAGNLQARIDRLAVKVVQMDGLQEESTSMHDSLNTKPFQSSMMFDQQVCARQTLPPGMSKIYLLCDRPPPLDKLNSLRDDGKDGLKFYTDPSYFFELWRQDMLKDTERVMYDKVKKPHHKPKNEAGARHKKRVRQPHSTRERQRHVAIEHGEHIMNLNTAMRDTQDGMVYSPEMMQHQQQRQNARPNSIEFKYQNDQTYNNEVNNDYRHQQQMQQNHYEAYNNQQSHLNNHHRYYPVNVNSPPPPYESPAAYARASTPRSNSSVNQTPSGSNGFRPSQPPPAPPPLYNAGTPPSSHSGTPTRSMRGNVLNNRETLPPPPPPPIEHVQQNGYQQSPQTNGHDQSHYQHHMQYQNYERSMNSGMIPPPMAMIDDPDDLPPPPTPDQSNLVMAMGNLRPPSMPDDHLPPSPPPPLLDEPSSYQQHPQAIPPPPPPPPNISNGNMAPTGYITLTAGKPKENAVKRHGPMAAAAWDGRSELLKAIRSGIELRKVDRKEPAKEEKAASAYHDVASILARRVAVEMSDSESGSDSEYDSDGWGDEVSA